MNYEEQWEKLKTLLRNNIKFCDKKALEYLGMDGEDLSPSEIIYKAEELKRQATDYRMILSYMKLTETAFNSIATGSIYI
jgi:hypothetical protein